MVQGSTDIINVANVHKCIQISIARVLNKHFKYYILILFLLKDKYYNKWANGVVVMLNCVGISLFNVFIKVQLSVILYDPSGDPSFIILQLTQNFRMMRLQFRLPVCFCWPPHVEPKWATTKRERKHLEENRNHVVIV